MVKKKLKLLLKLAVGGISSALGFGAIDGFNHSLKYCITNI